jgi:hypothetical protein
MQSLQNELPKEATMLYTDFEVRRQLVRERTAALEQEALLASFIRPDGVETSRRRRRIQERLRLGAASLS